MLSRPGDLHGHGHLPALGRLPEAMCGWRISGPAPGEVEAVASSPRLIRGHAAYRVDSPASRVEASGVDAGAGVRRDD
jgi:hypothetical protein